MAQIDLEAISERLNLSLDHIVGTSLFSKARYFIAPSITPQRSLELSFLLDNNGAKKAEQGLEDEELNLIITNSLRFEGWQSVSGKEGVELVTDLWVEKGLITGKLQLASHFSPDPSMIFSGVIACATSIPVTDYEVLQAGITALGGQWRSGLTKDVTHLFAISQDSQKYATAFNFKDQTGVKVLLPHWFDDAMRLGTGKLDTTVYEWPEPRLLMSGPQVDEEMAKMLKAEAVRMEQDERRMSLFATTAMFTPSNHNPQATQSGIITDKNIKFVGAAAAHAQVWNGKRILLSRTLQVWQGRFEAVQKSIERAGGVVVRFDGDDEEEEMAEGEERVNGDGDGGGSQKAMLGPLRLSKNEKQRRKKEAEAVDRCDVYVTRWRNGRAFINAFNQDKIIGTLAWLFQVQSSGIMSNPPDQLLHYPIPQRTIEGISNHVISVTNYTGEAREYLKKLITTMGARFTPSMSGQNTVLIAAYTSGTKATKALSWSIAVVNHTWLEDCFIQWRNLTVATEKYISFPPGMDFAGMLGTRGLNMESIREEVVDLERVLEEQEAEEAEEEQRELERLKLKEEEQEAIALGATRGDVDMRVPVDEEEEEEEANPPGNTDSSMKEVQGLVDSNILSPQHDMNMDIDLSMDARGSALDMDMDWQFREDEFGALSPVARKSITEAKGKAKEQSRGRREEMEVEGPRVMEEIEMIDDDEDRDSGVVPASTRTPARSPVKPTKSPAKATEPVKTPAKTPAKTPIKSRMKGKSPKKKGNETSPLPPLSSEDEDDLPVVKKPTKKASAQPAPQPSPSPSPQPAPVPDILELSDDDDIEEVDFRAMATTQPRDKGKSKEAPKPVTKKRRALQSSSEDEEASESEARKEKGKEKQKAKETAKVVGKTKGKGKAKTPPPTSPSDRGEEVEEEEVVPPSKRPLTRRLSKADAEAGATRVKEKLKELEKQGEREKEAKRGKGKQPAERDETRSPTPEPVNKRKLTRKVTVEIIRSPVKKSAAVLLKEQEEEEKEKEKEKLKAKKGRKFAREDFDEDEYQASKVTGNSSAEESDDDDGRKKKKTPVKPTKTPAKPPAAGKEQKKPAKGRNAAKSSDDEDEVDVVPIPKAKGASSKSKKSAPAEKNAPAPPTAGPTSTGMLKRAKGDARTKVKKRKSGEKSAQKEIEVESEDEEEERVVNVKRVVKGTKANAKMTRKVKGKAVESEDEDEDEEVEDLIMPDSPATSKKDKGKGKASKDKAAERSEDEEDEEEQPRKKALKKPLRVYSTEEEDASSKDDEVSNKAAAKPKGKVATSTNAKSSSKGKANAKKAVETEESETESETDEEIQPKKGRPTKKPTTAPPAPKGKGAPKSKSKPGPVLTPDDTEEEEEEAEVSAVVSPRTARAVARTQSLKAVAGETRAKSPSTNISARSRKTSISRPTTSKTTSRVPLRRDDEDEDAMDVDEPAAGPSRLRADTNANTSATPNFTISGAPPRRSAATKASQKLRDTIMPDVMNFENQRRKSRKSGTAAFVVIGDSVPREDAESSAKRRRESFKDKEGSKGVGDEEEEEGAEKPKKKRRVSNENEVVAEGKGKAKDEAGSGKARRQKMGKPSIKPSDIVVMTTQVSLPDDTLRTLDKLGVKFTTTPEECTHLIAASFVRTEKFICALASKAPHILTKEWAVDSANAGELLPVEKYGLKDPEGEKRYNVKLADSLKRAKANQGGKLLNGAQIFVTPKVAVAVKKELLSHVIQACGGVCKHPSDFTQRMIKGHENRYLISCPEDKPIWSRFSNQDIPVYSHELILNGALQQRMDWDDDKYRLDKR